MMFLNCNKKYDTVLKFNLCSDIPLNFTVNSEFVKFKTLNSPFTSSGNLTLRGCLSKSRAPYICVKVEVINVLII